MEKNKTFKGLLLFFLLIFTSFVFSGCAVMFKKTPPEEVREAKKLKREVKELDAELEKTKKEKEIEINRLKESMASLQRKLQKEMQDENIKLKMEERGLIITILDRILFDPGKAKLKTESYNVMNKVAGVLLEELPGQRIGIEGHTDNQPIKYSGWKSNWELSTARALSVLYYFEDKGIESSLMSAIGYGPYRPIASNDTVEGREKNRRVEIVVLPELSKVERKTFEKTPYDNKNIK